MTTPETTGRHAHHTNAAPREDFFIPRGPATSGRLVFINGARGLTLTAETGDHFLAHGRSLREVAWVGFEAGVLVVAGPLFPTPDRRGSAAQPGGEIALNPALPWEIEIRGRASRLAARLGQVQLRALDLLGGVEDLIVELASPVGTAYIYLAGGARRVILQRPAGVGVRVHSLEGLTRLTLDGRRYGQVRGDIHLESAGFRHASGHYEISITGEASDITITGGSDS